MIALNLATAEQIKVKGTLHFEINLLLFRLIYVKVFSSVNMGVYFNAWRSSRYGIASRFKKKFKIYLFVFFVKKLSQKMHKNFRKNVQNELKHRTVSRFFKFAPLLSKLKN